MYNGLLGAVSYGKAPLLEKQIYFLIGYAAFQKPFRYIYWLINLTI